MTPTRWNPKLCLVGALARDMLRQIHAYTKPFSEQVRLHCWQPKNTFQSHQFITGASYCHMSVNSYCKRLFVGHTSSSHPG